MITSDTEITPQERADINSALLALRNAQQRAMQSGAIVTVVKDGQLVRRGPNGITILKQIARYKSQVRWKRATKRGN